MEAAEHLEVRLLAFSADQIQEMAAQEVHLSQLMRKMELWAHCYPEQGVRPLGGPEELQRGEEELQPVVEH